MKHNPKQNDRPYSFSVPKSEALSPWQMMTNCFPMIQCVGRHWRWQDLPSTWSQTMSAVVSQLLEKIHGGRRAAVWPTGPLWRSISSPIHQRVSYWAGCVVGSSVAEAAWTLARPSAVPSKPKPENYILNWRAATKFMLYNVMGVSI